MFEAIANGISELFHEVVPQNFCVGCFLEGFVKGAALAIVTVVAIAALPAELAVAATVALAALGVYGVTQLAKNWSKMSDGAKSEALGNIAGSVAGGFTGAKLVGPVEAPPGIKIVQTEDSGAVPLVTEEGAGAGGAAAAGVPEGVTNVSTVSADEANAPFVNKGWSPPYAEGTDVTKFTTTEETPQQFSRVHTADNPQGAFLVRSDDIAGMNADQIQQQLALPNKPTSISDVNVPPGTNMQMGTVGAQPGFGAPNVGGTQFQLLNPIPASSFTNTRPLP